MTTSNALLDKDFLKKLHEFNQREIYVKIISLNYDENPIAEIEGCVLSGNINVDGASAVRRTCNLTLTSNTFNINEKDWALKTKFKLYIGLRNFIDKQYEDIIWFKMGTYILNSFNITSNASDYTISISGKDKMCLLNGDVGGNVFATHDFGGIWTIHKDGSQTKEDIPIKEIIVNAIHTYALEDFSRIIINDLDSISTELLDYKGKDSYVYIIEKLGKAGVWETQIVFSTDSLSKELDKRYSGNRVPSYDAYSGADFEFNGGTYHFIKKVEYGQTIGRRYTDLIYPDDLIISAGGTIAQMLDKLTGMLGEFEYFYDVDGNFVFQRKKIYMNFSWNNQITNEKFDPYYDSSANPSAIAFEFNKGQLIESLQNKLNVNNIKNDYSIWGKRKSLDVEIPFHLRYAIDDKPKFYYSLTKNKLYVSNEVGGDYDWREVLYQMAIDDLHIRGMYEKEKLLTYEEWLKNKREEGIDQILNYILDHASDFTYVDGLDESLYKDIWGHGYEAYYADMLAFWPQIYRTSKNVITSYDADGLAIVDEEGNYVDGGEVDPLTDEEWQEWKDNNYWNPQYTICNIESNNKPILHNPEDLIFWIDFLDEDAGFMDYKVSVIGRRTEVINEDQIKAISYRGVPPILFISPESDALDEPNISYIRMNIPSYLQNYIDISTQGKSAKEVLDSSLYEHTYYQNNINISAIPIYYLQPNTRIRVQNGETNTDGEYIIKQISYQISYDGMMQITATKAEEEII